MKATAIQVKVSELVTLERAVPEMAIATITIKFQLTGRLSFLQDERVPREQKEEKLSRLLMKTLRELELQ